MGAELPHALIGTLTTTLRTWLDGLQNVLEVETDKLESLLRTPSLRYQGEEASGLSVTVARQSSDSIPRADLCNLPADPRTCLCSESPAIHAKPDHEESESLKQRSTRQPNSNHLVEVLGLDDLESDFESKFGPLTTIVRTLLSELRCVFAVETSKLEALFCASVLRLGTTLPCQSEAPSDPQPYLHPCALVTDSVHVARFQERSASSQLGVASPESVSKTTIEASKSRPIEASKSRPIDASKSRPNEPRSRRLVLEEAELDMAESAFQAKFCQGGLGLDGRTLLPSFASPVPIVQDGFCQNESDKVTMNSTTATRNPRRFVIDVIPFVVPRLCGIIPWDGRWKRASSAYQWGVVLSLCGCVGGQLCEIVNYGNSGFSMHVCFTFGTLLSLLASGLLWRSRSFVHCIARLDAYMVAYDCRYRSDLRCCVDFASSLFVLVVVIVYFWVNDDDFTPMECIFVVVGLFFCGIECYIMHMCRMAGCLVDVYFEQCPEVLSEHIAKDAIKEWYLVDSLCRLVSSTVQNCFVSLQLTATVLLCFLLADHLRGEISSEFIVPTLLCAVSVLRIALCAASVSEKCAKLPRLLISSGNGEMEPGRKQVVEYITHCKSGFFLFGMRLSMELVFKLLYSCAAATFALVSQSVLKSFDRN